MAFNNINKFIKRWKDIWSELHISSAALAYYTLIGIVPLCMLFSILSSASRTPIDMSPAVSMLIPDLDDSIVVFTDMASNSLSSLYERYHWFGWIAFAVVIYAVYCFMNNIQRAFNNIWESDSRKFKDACSLYVKMVLVLAIVLGAFAAIVKFVNSILCKYLLLFVLLSIIISLAYKTIPYDKKPRLSSAIISAVAASFLIVLLSLLLPWFVNGIRELRFDGIKVLLFVFWLFWVWFVCLSGVVLCRRIDKSGYYMEDKIKDLAPNYRRFLSLMVVSHIFRCFRKTLAPLSFEDIRKGMFRFDNGEDHNVNDKVSLPMPLLDNIIDELVKRQIVEAENTGGCVRYRPNTKYEDFTIGDVLFNLDSNGNYTLDYPYWILKEPLEAELSSRLLKVYADDYFKSPVIELIPDKQLVRINDDQLSISKEEDRIDQYNTYKIDDCSEKILAGFITALQSNGKDGIDTCYSELMGSIDSMPDIDGNKHMQMDILKKAKRIVDGRMPI